MGVLSERGEWHNGRSSWPIKECVSSTYKYTIIQKWASGSPEHHLTERLCVDFRASGTKYGLLFLTKAKEVLNAEWIR